MDTKNTEKAFKDYSILILILLWLGHLINLYIWLKLDNNYLTYDSHRHFLMSLKIFDAYKNFPSKVLSRFIDATQLHPPLVGIITAPFYFLLGSSQDIGVMLNATIFLAILTFSIYKIGEKIADKKVGLLAAFIITMYPVVFNQLKVYMLDLPLMVMVTLSIYFLIASDNLKNLKYSIFFGISSGLGMLTKDSFPLYIIGPLGYMIIRNIFILRRENYKFKRYTGHLIVLGLLILLISSPYYLKKISTVLIKARPSYVRTWLIPVLESSLFLHRLRALLWYLWGFINWQVSFLFFSAFIVGLFFFSRTKVKDKGIFIFWILVSWILASYFRYVIQFDMEVTGVRYTMPILPAIALISATGIMQIPFKKMRVLSIFMIVILGIFQLFIISYYPAKNILFKQISLPLNLPEKIKVYKLLPESIVVFNPKGWAVSGSDSGSRPRNAKNYLTAIEKIFKIINSSRGSKKGISIFVIPDDTRLWYLQHITYVEKEPFQIFCDWNYLRRDIRREGITISDLVLISDYIIDKDGGWLGEPYVQCYVKDARNHFDLYKDKFTLLGKVKWPDKSNILIYNKKQQNN